MSPLQDSLRLEVGLFSSSVTSGAILRLISHICCPSSTLSGQVVGVCFEPAPLRLAQRVQRLEMLLSAAAPVMLSLFLLLPAQPPGTFLPAIPMFTSSCARIFSGIKSPFREFRATGLLHKFPFFTKRTLCHHLPNISHHSSVLGPEMTVEFSSCLQQGHQIPP